MKLIDNIELLKAFHEIKSTPPPHYDYHYQDLINSFPDPIRKIIEAERYLQPKHVSQDVVKAVLIRQCKFSDPSFRVDKNVESLIDTICLYLRQDPAFLTIKKGYDFNRGLLIRGKVGCGKTSLIKGINGFLKLFDFSFNHYDKVDLTFQLVESWKISELFSRVGFEFIDGEEKGNPIYKINDKSICIDDLGSEPIGAHFGNNVNIVGHILMDRYSRFKTIGRNRNQIITHATSNLDLKTIKAYYGERVFSRMFEMFNDIIYPGEDRRQ